MDRDEARHANHIKWIKRWSQENLREFQIEVGGIFKSLKYGRRNRAYIQITIAQDLAHRINI